MAAAPFSGGCCIRVDGTTPSFPYSIVPPMKRNQKLRVESGEEGLRLDRYLRTVFPDVPSRSVRLALEAGACPRGRQPGRQGQGAPLGGNGRRGGAGGGRGLASGPGRRPRCRRRVFGRARPRSSASPPTSIPSRSDRTKPGRSPVFLRGDPSSRRPDCFGTGADAAHCGSITSTSGAVPAALDEGSLRRALRREREVGRIEKIYLCLVEGEVGSSLEIDRRIESEGGGNRSRAEGAPGAGLPPVDPGSRTGAGAGGEGRWSRARISTGKRHQIRAHTWRPPGIRSSATARYGAVPGGEPGHSRLMLHAETVVFPHPGTGGADIGGVSRAARVRTPLRTACFQFLQTAAGPAAAPRNISCTAPGPPARRTGFRED